MTNKEKKQHVDNILTLNEIFDDLLGREEELLHYRPEEDFWTIHEHVVHCLEVDIANFTRYRKGIIQPGAEIISMDERWTDMLNYKSIDMTDAVQAIKLIRKITHSHLLTLIDKDWKEYSFFYDKYGILNFEAVIPVFTRHPQFHRELIDRNIKAYQVLK